MNGHRGRRRLLALAIGCLVAAPVFGWVDTPARAATTTVLEQGTQYVPRQVDVAPGDTVMWSFSSAPADSPRHTVTFDDGTDLNRGCPGVLLNDCQDTPGETVQRRFASAGTYPYYCKIHRSAGMVGVVVVSSSATSSSTTGPGGSSSTVTTRSSTTTTTRTTSSTASTTSTTRALATSSTLVKSTTTTSDTSSVLLPGAAPSFSDDTSNAAKKSGGSDGGSDTGTVVLIVGLLLAASAGGGFLLWRLRPGRG